jgi:chorismate mutase
MDLGDWRSRISELDNQILNLLNQRAEAALQIGDLKRRQDAPSYVPEREAAILEPSQRRQPAVRCRPRRSSPSGARSSRRVARWRRR